jgi:acyl-homoserine-lactone acylase
MLVAKAVRRQRTGARARQLAYTAARVMGNHSRSVVALAAVAAALALLPAAAPGASEGSDGNATSARAAAGGTGPLGATIRRSRLGVPHITAQNLPGVAAGYAWAFAEDNICTLADEFVTVSAQRSRFFGPDETWTFSGNGSTYSNLDADFYFQWVKETRAVERLLRQEPPAGPLPAVKRGVRGYVRGYNAYLRRTGVDNLPDRRCRGAEWVRPIKPIDLYRRFFQLGILASSGVAIEGIAGAAPVSPTVAARQQAKADELLEDGSALQRLQPDAGSNAYGFGREATANGKGLVLGNPHFPWDGAERLYQVHLRIPGKLNVAGASLYGVPLVLIGHTRGLAWSHTVATAWRFTPFRLTLPPGDPHSYVVDGEVRPMQATEVTVRTRTDDGGLRPESRTIHSTEYGPMLTDLVGIPLPWTDGQGFALADVNTTNFRYLNHFFANQRAQTVHRYDRIQRRFQGIPWVNSIAADSRGNAYYTMQGAIPYVPDAKAQECNVAQPAFSTLGLPILDGSRSACEWETSPDAVVPGTFPPAEVPTTIRSDYVHNGNDSHWLTNPAEPLTGFDRIIGIEDAERTLRTRIGLIQAEERLAGADGRPGNRFNLRSLERVMLGNRNYAGELWRDGLVQLCDSAPGGMLVGSSGPVDVSGACHPLRGWDLREDLDSAGAVLFRRFATNALANFTCLPTGLQGGTCPGMQMLFSQPLYDNSDPVNTPGGGLNIANPLVGRALADAVSDMEAAGLPLDAALRGVQSDVRGGREIPIHGGPGGPGVFNVISSSWDPEAGGYKDVFHGASFIMAAAFRDGKCPVRASTFVTYGQSENQSSRHASDYTRAYSRKRWNRPPFCAGQVRKQTVRMQRVRIGRRAAARGR